MMKKGHIVKNVAAGSIAEEMEILPGDRILAISGTEIEDIFDYFKETYKDNLKEAINELGRDYTEEEIRLVRIKFLSEMGN